MSTPLRVRFAPSPTGFFHVGSARTALFNWLAARHGGGTYLLRIEDTDAERNREEWVDVINTSLSWLGLDPDEGPFRQSANADAHVAAAEALYGAGFCYACACTPEMVAERKGDNKTPGYDGYCRDRDVARSNETALRFKVPREGETVVHDLVRGDVVVENSVIEDFVVARSNGKPLYLLANMVDDRLDEITHVIRGEDHISNTPKQILLWEALDQAEGEGVPLPAYAHLPLLVNEQRKKLSKRKDPVSVESYRDQGFLSEAFVNFLALLGWSPKGDAERVDVATMIEQFTLSDVNNSPAFFDVAKLTHLNGAYIRDLPLDDFIERSRPWVNPVAGQWAPSDHVVPWTPAQFDEDRYRAIAPLVQERIATFSEITPMIDFLFLDTAPIDEASWTKAIGNDDAARSVLETAKATYATCGFDAATLYEATVAFGEKLGLKLRKVQAPIRVAVTGKTVGPPLFESLVLLGRDDVIARIDHALSLLPPS